MSTPIMYKLYSDTILTDSHILKPQTSVANEQKIVSHRLMLSSLSASRQLSSRLKKTNNKKKKLLEVSFVVLAKSAKLMVIVRFCISLIWMFLA